MCWVNSTTYKKKKIEKNNKQSKNEKDTDKKTKDISIIN
jgi:hypothetical protein